MSLFDRFRKTPAKSSQEPVDSLIRQKLVDLVFAVLRDKDNRIRVEDAISAAATIVAERCIDAAADYPLRDHQLTPGSRVFSTKANELICGDILDLKQLPEQSIVGLLRN